MKNLLITTLIIVSLILPLNAQSYTLSNMVFYEANISEGLNSHKVIGKVPKEMVIEISPTMDSMVSTNVKTGETIKSKIVSVNIHPVSNDITYVIQGNKKYEIIFTKDSEGEDYILSRQPTENNTKIIGWYCKRKRTN